jgi:hypothetical protein
MPAIAAPMSAVKNCSASPMTIAATSPRARPARRRPAATERAAVRISPYERIREPPPARKV